MRKIYDKIRFSLSEMKNLYHLVLCAMLGAVAIVLALSQSNSATISKSVFPVSPINWLLHFSVPSPQGFSVASWTLSNLS